MKNKIYVAILLAASALVPAFATAGLKSTHEVAIGATPGVSGRTRAQGSIMGARNSADSVQYIGCRANQEIGYCYAKDKAGRAFMCSSSAPAMLTAITAVNASSHLIIDADGLGICRNLEITNMSRYVADVASPTAIINPPGSSLP